MDKIEKELRKQGICVRIEYTGSTYEGTKVAKSQQNYDLEFDVMVIIDCRGSVVEVENLPDSPGFAKLKIVETASGEKKRSVFGEVEGGYLNAEKTARKFYGVMYKLIQSCHTDNSCPYGNFCLKENIVVRSHGPATQIDVRKEGERGFFYSVDVVPTYETKTNERYVAKPIKGEKNPNQFAWRRSFSIEEKAKLATVDSNNTCRKKVLRTLKVIRNKEPCLDQLTSYHLKTALFHEMDKEQDWKEDMFGQRLMGVLHQLEKRLSEKNLPHYFLGKRVNLLQAMSDVSISNMTYRLKHLRNSEIEMKKVLEVKLKASA